MTRLEKLYQLQDRLAQEIAVELVRRDLPAVETPGGALARQIVAEVCAAHGVPVAEVLSPTRARRGARRVVAARHDAAYMLRTLGLSYPQIGEVLGLDHSTVLRGVRIATRRREQALELAEAV